MSVARFMVRQRLAGVLQRAWRISGRIVIEAEVDLASTARRLRAAIAEVYGHQSEIIVVSAGGLRRASRYVVRVVRDGEALARQTGLLDGRGRPVRGLPSAVVNGSAADADPPIARMAQITAKAIDRRMSLSS